MTIDALPTAPSIDDPANFAARADAFVAALATFRTQANALAAAMNAVAAGTAIAVPYAFSTTTTDADPGAGYMRLSSATQNASTTLRLSTTDAAAIARSATLATFDDSTSTIKARVRLQKSSDPESWLLFDLTAMAAPGSPDPGYRNFTIAIVDQSAVSPFSEGDDLLVMVAPSGDKGSTGDTGPAGNALVLLSTVSANNSATVDIETTFDSTYDEYLLVATGITMQNDGESMRMQMKIGGSYLATSTYFYHLSAPNSAASTYTGYSAAISGMETSLRVSGPIGNAAGEHLNFRMSIANPAGTALSKTAAWYGEGTEHTAGDCVHMTGSGGNTGTGALTGLRFFMSVADIVAGDFRLYGYKKV